MYSACAARKLYQLGGGFGNRTFTLGDPIRRTPSHTALQFPSLGEGQWIISYNQRGKSHWGNSVVKTPWLSMPASSASKFEAPRRSADYPQTFLEIADCFNFYFFSSPRVCRKLHFIGFSMKIFRDPDY